MNQNKEPAKKNKTETSIQSIDRAIRILHCFETKIVSGNPVLLEHQDSRWLNAEELHNLMWLKSDLDVLEDIKKIMLDRR